MKHNFSIYDLPTHELPLFEEQPGSEWINYGFDNLYGDYLRDLYLGSSIHTTVVNGVAEMIAGEGNRCNGPTCRTQASESSGSSSLG